MTDTTKHQGRLVDTGTGEILPDQTAHPYAPTPIADAAAVAVRAGSHELSPFQAQLDELLRPHTLDLVAWAQALFQERDFPEQDPDEASKAMLASILLAGSSEEALASMELDRAKELCGDEPGGKSGMLRIHSARPIRSDFEDGPACYVIVDATQLGNGAPVRFTTGAAQVQAVILWHVGHGKMPFDGMLSIRRERTRQGYYPLNLTAGG